MSLYEFFGTIEVGLVFGLVALGAFFSFRILKFPDLTVEGSFPLGAAIAAVLILAGINAWIATLLAAFGGFLAGLLTAYLNVRFNILNLLAGILVSIGLYSVNLRIMGGPNAPLLGQETIFSGLSRFNAPSYYLSPLLIGVIVLVIKMLLDVFLSTGVGLSMRSAGANPDMSAANGIDVGRMKLLGLGIANSLTAFSGGIFAQLFGSADAYMGIGVVIVGLASVIVGTTLIPSRRMIVATFACLIGALLYRLAVAFALNADGLSLKASDVQLVTAILVTLTLILQYSPRRLTSLWRRKGRQ